MSILFLFIDGVLQKLYPSTKSYLQKNIEKICGPTWQDALRDINIFKDIIGTDSVQSNEYLKDSCDISDLCTTTDILSSILDAYVKYDPADDEIEIEIEIEKLETYFLIVVNESENIKHYIKLIKSELAL